MKKKILIGTLFAIFFILVATSASAIKYCDVIERIDKPKLIGKIEDVIELKQLIKNMYSAN